MEDIIEQLDIPQIIQILSFIAAAGGMIGAYLNANLKISGWVMWFIGNTLWILIGWYYKNWGMMAQFLVYDIFNVIGFITWSKHPNFIKERTKK